MQKLTPFLWFDDNAEAAAKFYVSVFKPGKIAATTRYLEGGPGPVGSVMTVEFLILGQKFVALNGGPLFKFNESISFVVNCKTQREVDYYWRKLTAGGGKPGQCGWLKDKFGVSWQIVPTALPDLFKGKDQARSARVLKVMMGMKKLNIAQLKRAGAAPARQAGKR
jgi:predicted 3-demethylubiquinone-9 3-methyltransferase (glyoxalase superfamily)